MNMDFESIKAAAIDWTRSGSTDIEFVVGSESERKLEFSLGSHMFYVICPESANSNWHVWSDDDIVLAHMADVQDYVMSCKEKSITDILKTVNKSLLTLQGAAGEDEEDDLDDGYDEDYYAEEDLDAMQDDKPLHESDDEADQYFVGQGSVAAVSRLTKDLKNLKESKGKYGVEGNPRGDNLFIWDVKLTDFPKDTPLGRDLQDFAKRYKREPVVYMELKFPSDYPMQPPFARVLRPRFKFLTGHVTIGGSVCMEMLTRSGWRPTNDIESILVQIRSEVMSDPKTRLDSNPDRQYSETEAKQAFERMVQRYGWNK